MPILQTHHLGAPSCPLASQPELDLASGLCSLQTQELSLLTAGNYGVCSCSG